MKLDNKNEVVIVQKIYKKILEVYPFLTKTEKNIFDRKSKIVLDKSLDGSLVTEDAIKNLLHLLNKNGHADIKEWHKTNREFIREAKIKKSPTFNIEERILFIKIPSWLMWLGKIDKKLVSFCKNNIKKYDALIIDVRENQGGSSGISHDFASIFFKKVVEYGKFVKKTKNGRLKTTRGKLEPNKNIFIDKPTAILISNKCFSSNELFLAPFKISKRAVLIGQPTAGGSANSISEVVKISGKKFVVRIPTWHFFLKGKNKPIEKTKIIPDIIYNGSDIENFSKNYLLKVIKN